MILSFQTDRLGQSVQTQIRLLLGRISLLVKPPCSTFIVIKAILRVSKFLGTLQNKWEASSEFVSSSIPSWQIVTAQAQPFRVARDLAFCLRVPLDSLPVWASSGGSGETARMRRLAWTFAARIGDKYQIRLTRPK